MLGDGVYMYKQVLETWLKSCFHALKRSVGQRIKIKDGFKTSLEEYSYTTTTAANSWKISCKNLKESCLPRKVHQLDPEAKSLSAVWHLSSGQLLTQERHEHFVWQTQHKSRQKKWGDRLSGKSKFKQHWKSPQSCAKLNGSYTSMP